MSDTSDLDQQIEQLRKCEIIKESEVKNLCAKAREILGNKEDRIKKKKHRNVNSRAKPSFYLSEAAARPIRLC